jgi:hypothetical protein
VDAAGQRRLFERPLEGTLLVAFDGEEIMALQREDGPPALMASTGAESLALWGSVTRAGPVASRVRGGPPWTALAVC